jgi:hypothetical protein
LERVPNQEKRRIIQTEETILDRIGIRKLRWFGHLMRMPEERWPAKIHHGSQHEEGRRDNLGSHGGMVSQRQWK